MIYYKKGVESMEYKFSNRISALQPSAIREILKMSSDPAVIPFSAGNPAPEAFPVEAIAEISKRILEENPVGALQYSLTEGYPALRNTMKDFVLSRYGISKAFDELIIVSGATQGIELSCKVLCNEGDTIICEDPSFVGSLNAFRSYSAHLVGIPLEEDGMDMDKLEAALKENPNTKFIYVIPNFQNPTGKCMSLKKRQQLYQIACRYNVMILEDNPYGDLRFDGEEIPAIKTLDEEGRVIYVGSFSKVLSPGMRVGYLIAPAALVNKIVVAKQCADVHTNILSQMICNEFMTTCDVEAHLNKLKAVYKRRCELMLQQMDCYFAKSITYTRPQGGLFIWATLPEGVNMLEFCKRAIKECQVAVVPGNAFSVMSGEDSRDFRLNFSTPTEEQIAKGIEALGKLTHNL